MDLPQLHAFLAVARTLHFGHAAERLHLAQPAVSARVRALEASLGVALFERTTRSVALTAAGLDFLPEAEAAVAQVAKAGAAARRAAGRDRPVLRLAGIDSATVGLCPFLIRASRHRHPDLDFRVTEMLSREANEALARGFCDMAFGRLPPAARDVTGRLVLRERIVAILPEDHPLTARPHLAAADFAGVALVMPSRQHRPVLHDILTGWLAEGGVHLPPVLEANERHMMLALVASGLGLSLAPAWVASFAFAGVAFRPLEETAPRVETYAIWRGRDADPYLAGFVAGLPDAPID